ncbi:MAG: PfkB family carbohydrate kinase [Rhodobacteraceae bacterium]|nr:PfkB family carbohydrate kinase [Paracoccaceae bacterium]
MTGRIFFCGEALIDLITKDGVHYHATPGGSPFSASKAAAQAGANAHFCGTISSDIFGRQILADLDAYGVDATFAPRSDAPTVLAFVQVREDAHPVYAFFDRESCMINMDPELPPNTLNAGDVLGIGSISLIVSPGADRIAEFALAQSARATLAIDPNVRPGMIKGHGSWRPRMDRLMRHSDIIKISTEDLEYYRPENDPESFSRQSLAAGAGLVIVTDGENGAAAWTDSGHARIVSIPAAGGDTVGAGDTVMGYSLAWLAEASATAKDALNGLGDDALASMLRFAIMAASLNCALIGCNPPARSEVEAALFSR